MNVEPFQFKETPFEYRITPLRECPTPEQMALGDCPENIAKYWRASIATSPLFDREREWFAVVFLNSRRRIVGHQLVSSGTIDSVVVSPRDVFRLAIMASAAAIVVCHNHPSGDASPSEADVKITRDLIRAGQILKIDVCDHIILGNGQHTSLRELGYFSI